MNWSFDAPNYCLDTEMRIFGHASISMVKNYVPANIRAMTGFPDIQVPDMFDTVLLIIENWLKALNL